MTKMVKTNMGMIPLEDYLDIRARQCGFEDYEEMKANGIYIDAALSVAVFETENVSIFQNGDMYEVLSKETGEVYAVCDEGWTKRIIACLDENCISNIAGKNTKAAKEYISKHFSLSTDAKKLVDNILSVAVLPSVHACENAMILGFFLDGIGITYEELICCLTKEEK